MDGFKRAFGKLRLTTEPYDHQYTGLMLSNGREYYGQLGEMGTGKTWILIVEAAVLFSMGKLDSVLVLAPKGVDANWMIKEIKRHCPVPVKMALWRAAARAHEREALLELVGDTKQPFSFDQPPAASKEPKRLEWLFMNWEALATKRGYETAAHYASTRRVMIIGDEIQRVKDPKTRVSKGLMTLKQWATFRRIGTGSPVLNSPFDLYGPFKFLHASILGTSFVAFKAKYAQMIGHGDPLYHAMLKKLASKHIASLQAKGVPYSVAKRQAETRAKHRMPKLVARDDEGKHIYRNLDELRKKVKPHSFRVLKKDCLDLPEKIYETIFFDMTPKQRELYMIAEKQLQLVIDDETIQPLTKLTAMCKLGQITSGFFIETAERITHRIPGRNPKQEVLINLLEELGDEQILIWASRRAEIDDVMGLCRKLKMPPVRYDGTVNDRGRERALAAFHGGDAQVFVGHPKSGGTGLTLTEAATVIYYSNNYSQEQRIQSEDRPHRIGQRRNVVYWDLVARGTLEERVIEALQYKTELASIINGDAR